MARPLRIEFDGAWYHVMNRGAGRRAIFLSARHREQFLELLGIITRIYGVEIHAYCLMANHYHLLVHTPTAGLGQAMRHLDGVYTQRFNRSRQTDGPLFRGRYKSVLVEGDSHLLQVSRYVHLNPVEAGLVETPEQYGDSSYRAYRGLEQAPAWLRTDGILGWFEQGDPAGGYREFVESGIDDETREFFAAARRPPVLGHAEFREQARIRARAMRSAGDPEIPDYKLLRQRPTIASIGAAVCRAFGVAPDDLRTSSPGRKGAGPARGALVHLGREVGGMSLGAIARWMGYTSHAAASRAARRLVDGVRTDPALRGRFEAAVRELSRAEDSR